MRKRQIQALEDNLAAAAFSLPKEDGSDPLHFHSEVYPGLVHRFQAAKADVAKLGLTDLVESTIRDCLVLVQQGKRKEAQDLLFATCSTLSEKSGTWDDMRRMYTASNDPKVT